MSAMRLIPPADSREEVARRLQIVERHKHLNAILGVNPQAQAEAERCQHLRRTGVSLGPLHGVPLIIKDNIDCAGLPVTLGCRALAEVTARADAPVIARLRRAGAVILARANMSEFAFDVRSRSSLGGDVRNPLRPATTAGGSSGGSAAAVAIGMADGALGTDTGGSIRIPASYTSLVGLRPAFRRQQLAGIAPLSPSKDTVGPMVHSVQDAALLHAILHDRPVKPLEALTLSGVRLGRICGLEGDDPAQQQVWQAALESLRAAGATIVDVPLPILSEVESELCLSLYEFQLAFDDWLTARPHGPSSLRALVDSGEYLPEFLPLLTQIMTYTRLKNPLWLRGRRFQRRLRQVLGFVAEHYRIQAFLYPTVQRLPDSLAKMPPGCGPELAAIAGQPAITLPCGSTRQGMPVGMELMGIARDEWPLLALAYGCELALSEQVAAGKKVSAVSA